jgi:hypothetical protein
MAAAKTANMGNQTINGAALILSACLAAGCSAPTEEVQLTDPLASNSNRTSTVLSIGQEVALDSQDYSGTMSVDLIDQTHFRINTLALRVAPADRAPSLFIDVTSPFSIPSFLLQYRALGSVDAWQDIEITYGARVTRLFRSIDPSDTGDNLKVVVGFEELTSSATLDVPKSALWSGAVELRALPIPTSVHFNRYPADDLRYDFHAFCDGAPCS